MSLGESIAAKIIIGIAKWGLSPSEETALRNVLSKGVSAALEKVGTELGPDDANHFHTLLADLFGDEEVSATLVQYLVKKERLPVAWLRDAFKRHDLVVEDFPPLEALCDALTSELGDALEKAASRSGSPLANLVHTKQLSILVQRQTSTPRGSTASSCNPSEEWTENLIDRLSRTISREPTDDTCSAIEHEIERAKECLLKADPRGAVSILIGLKHTRWNECTVQQRFRITANLGHAEEQTGDLKRAAALYLEAKQYLPDSPRARLLEICARLYQGEREAAFELASALVNDHPDENDCWPAIVFSSPDDAPISKTVELIPEHIRSYPDVAFALSRKALHQGELRTAEDFARIALKGKPDSIGVREQLALVLLELTASRVPGVELSPDVRRKVEEAADLLRQIVDDFEKATDYKMRARMAYNLGTAFLLLGKTNDGERARSLAFQLEGRNPDYIMGYAGLLALRHEYDDALAVLANAAENPEWVECTVLMVEILIKRGSQGDTNTALTAIQNALKSGGTHEQASRLLLLDSFIEAATRTSHQAKLRESIESETTLDPAALLAVKAKMHLALGNATEAEGCAREAASTSARDLPLAIRRYIAIICLEVEELEGAFLVLKSFVTPEVFDDYAIGMLKCAMKLNERRTILDYCSKLRENGIYDIRAAEIELMTLDHYDETNDAITVCTEYLEHVSRDKDREILRVHLTAFGIKSNQLNLVERDIRKLPSPEYVSPEFGLEVVKLLTHVAPSIEVIDYAYRLFRENPGNRNARLAMIAAVLGAEKTKIEFPEPETVEPGVAVLLVDDTSKDEVWHIVEACPKGDVSLNELGADAPLGKRLLGKKKNDVVEVGGADDDTVSIRIANLLNKYAYRFQRCMSAPAQLTSGDTSIRKFHLPTKPDGGLDFEPILRTSERRSKIVEEALQAYREGSVSLEIVGNCVGIPTGLVISALASQKVQIHCCRGSAEERFAASRIVQNQCGMVLDTTAVATLVLVAGLKSIEPIASRLYIPEGVLLELRDVVRHQKELEHCSGFIGSEQGQLVYAKSDPELVRANAERWELAIDFLEKRCDRVGGLSRLELSPEDDETLVRVFGRGSAGAIAFSLKEGVPLWSDDLLAAVFVAEKGGKRVWTQVVLRHCLDNDHLDRERYAEMMMKILGASYDFTWLDDVMAQYAVREGLESRNSEPWMNLVEHLSSERISSENIIGFVATIIKSIWQTSQIEESRHHLTTTLLDMLATRPQGHSIIAGIVNNLDILFGLDVVTCARTKQFISAWFHSKSIIR